jgi:hypothetical protein
MAALDNLVYIQSPGSRDWTVREGDNVALQFTVKLNGTGVDLTAVTGTCSIRSDYASAVDIVTGTVTFPTPASGVCRVTLTAANTTTLAGVIPGSTAVGQQLVDVGVYDVELQDGTNQLTILGGKVIVSREVTP